MTAQNPNAASRLAPRMKLPLHPQFSQYMAGGKVYPINLEISPCGVCDASCGFCFYANTGELGKHRKAYLRTGRLSSILNEAAELGVKSISWTGGGEPSLHPDIPYFTSLITSLKMKQGMFTNALAEPTYNPVMLDWIRVTVTNRPLSLSNLKALRKCLVLSIAFNYRGVEDDPLLQRTLRIAEKAGVDYVQLRPALKFHGETVDILPPQIDHPLLHVSDYKFDEAKYPHSYLKCEGYHFIPFIWEDGNVDVCAYMRKHEGYTLGNIYQESLKEIMDRAPDYVKVHPNCQVCCKNHEINKLISESRNLADTDFP